MLARHCAVEAGNYGRYSKVRYLLTEDDALVSVLRR
ncbi:hypothetical protein ABIB51_004371 [Arthrobacter sp. UYCu712]